MNKELCEIIINKLNHLKTANRWKTDKSLAEALHLNSSDISKIRHFESYPNVFDDPYLKNVEHKIDDLLAVFVVPNNTKKNYFILYRYVLENERVETKEEVRATLLALSPNPYDREGSAEYWSFNLPLLKEDLALVSEKNDEELSIEDNINKYTRFYWRGKYTTLDTADFIKIKKYANYESANDASIIPMNIAQIVLYRGMRNNYENLNVIFGSYATTKNGYPVGGLLIVQRQNSLLEALEQMTQQMPNELLIELREKRWIAEYYLMKNLEQLPSNSLTSLLGNKDKEGFAGIYHFFTYNKQQNYVGRFAFWLKENGKVELVTRLRKYEGYAEISVSNCIHVHIYYGNDKRNRYDLTLRYHEKEDTHSFRHFKGVYAGIADSPEIGRVFLKQKEGMATFKELSEEMQKGHFENDYANKMKIYYDREGIEEFKSKYPEIAKELNIS